MYYYGQGVKVDKAKSATYFRKACDAGNWFACYNFAIYNNDNGDKQRAKELYKKACDLGGDDYTVQQIAKYNNLWKHTCSKYESVK